MVEIDTFSNIFRAVLSFVRAKSPLVYRTDLFFFLSYDCKCIAFSTVCACVYWLFRERRYSSLFDRCCTLWSMCGCNWLAVTMSCFAGTMWLAGCWYPSGRPTLTFRCNFRSIKLALPQQRLWACS